MSDNDPGPRGADDRGPIGRFWHAETGILAGIRDVLSSALMVLLVAGILFGISGVWPPMVAVKSGSMNPHMYKGDLVFVAEEDRFGGEDAVAGTGVVPNHVAQENGYQKFGLAGDVIVYRPNGQTRGDPIIHRAMFYVEEGENWYDRANENYVNGNSCREIANCPAPHDGFITKGDNPRSNRYYDQVQGMSGPVKPAWIEAKAMVRIPALGWIRLKWAELRRGGRHGPPTPGQLVPGAPQDLGANMAAIPYRPELSSAQAGGDPSTKPSRPEAADTPSPLELSTAPHLPDQSTSPLPDRPATA